MQLRSMCLCKLATSKLVNTGQHKAVHVHPHCAVLEIALQPSKHICIHGLARFAVTKYTALVTKWSVKWGLSTLDTRATSAASPSLASQQRGHLAQQIGDVRVHPKVLQRWAFGSPVLPQSIWACSHHHNAAE